MSLSAKLLLFFILFFLACFLSAIFFLKKLEAKREEQIFLTCQQVLQEKMLIDKLLEKDQDFEVFKSDKFWELKKEFEVLFISYQKEAKLLDEIPQGNQPLTEECLTALAFNGGVLARIEKRFAYLDNLKKTFQDFKDSDQHLEAKGFSGLTEEWVKQKKENALGLEIELEKLTPPIEEWREIDRAFKKTVQALVELWVNTEVALTRKTPVIYRSSYRVFKEDFTKLEIDLEKMEMLR